MAFDKTLPIEGALAPTYNDIMRADKAALEAALNAYMYFETGGTQTGQPRQGAARPYFQDAAPTTRLDGNHFDSTDLGTPWIDSNATIDNQYNILTAADGAGTNVWTPISNEIIAVLLAANRIFAGTLKSTGDFTVGANKVVVTAANGNTAIAGTLGVTGIATLADGSKNATSAAPAADAEFANKKYTDDLMAAEVAARLFGSRTTLDSTAGTLVKDEVYKVGSDGFVFALPDIAGTCVGRTDSSNPPTTIGGRALAVTGSFLMRVIKDEYWKITHVNTVGLSWLPTGSGTCVKQ